MLTKEKLKIYKRYNGDIDSCIRTGSKHEKSVMQNSDWYLIDELVQDMKLVQKGLSSDTYSKAFNDKLTVNCDNTETQELIKSFALVNQGTNKESFINKLIKAFKPKK